MKRLLVPLFILACTIPTSARPAAACSPAEVQAYRAAANLGNADAQFNLGILYRTGNGLPKDPTEAGKWYTKAANQGLAVAQLNLGVLYAYGEGFAKDLVQAHAWLSVADANGAKDARRVLTTIEKDMSEALKADAIALAKELSQRLPK